MRSLPLNFLFILLSVSIKAKLAAPNATVVQLIEAVFCMMVIHVRGTEPRLTIVRPSRCFI